MLTATLLVVAALTQTNASTECAIAIGRGASPAATQVCLAEAALRQAQAVPKDSSEWRRHLDTATALYKKALSLTADAVLKAAVIDRLLILFDAPMLDDESGMLATFRELATLTPFESAPLLRLAQYQESRGHLDESEETLLSARRLQPGDTETLRRLAQFFTRRAGAMHAAARAQAEPEQALPGTPDKDGIYRVGGDITPPRRFGNAAYPSDALAAGIDGSVVAEILVNEAGIVSDARVLKSIPPLDDAALKAVREWRYDPTIVDGKAVPVKMTVTVSFTRRK